MTSQKDENLVEQTRRYKFTQKEIKEVLGMKGDLHQLGLWEGQSPRDIEQNGEKTGEWIFYIETVERLDEDES